MAEDNVIDLQARKERNEAYRLQLKQIAEMVDAFRGELEAAATNLAMAGPWREWDATIPVGTVMEIGWASLSQTDDPNLDALAGVEIALMDAAEQLEDALGDA